MHPKAFGIDGVDKVKDLIKENLVALDIMKESSELEAAVSPPERNN